MEILGNGIVRDKGTFSCIKEQFLPLIFAHNVRIDFSEAESQDRCDNRRKHLAQTRPGGKDKSKHSSAGVQKKS